MHILTLRTKESIYRKSRENGNTWAFMQLSYKLHLTTVPGHTESMLNLPPNIIQSEAALMKHSIQKQK